MATDDDDAATLRERVRELEATVAQQQDTIQQLMPSRRAVLAGGAGLVGGAALTGQASAQSAAGQVGTSSEPVDVEAASVNADSVNTGEVTTNSVEESQSPFIKTWAQNGQTADERLDNALSTANDYDAIYLENAEYSTERTINKRVNIIGASNIHSLGATFTSDVTCDSRVVIEGVRIDNGVQITFNELNSGLQNCNLFQSAAVLFNDMLGHVINCQEGSVIFASGTTQGIVDSCRSVTVTDNGSNTVGDIA